MNILDSISHRLEDKKQFSEVFIYTCCFTDDFFGEKINFRKHTAVRYNFIDSCNVPIFFFLIII